MIKNLYVVEYSKDQQWFHIDGLFNTVEKNLRWFMDYGNRNDYKIIALCDSISQGHEICDKLKIVMKEQNPEEFAKYIAKFGELERDHIDAIINGIEQS